MRFRRYELFEENTNETVQRFWTYRMARKEAQWYNFLSRGTGGDFWPQLRWSVRSRF